MHQVSRLKGRIKKLEPVRILREVEKMQQMNKVAEVRRQMDADRQELERAQSQYMNLIESLNAERSSADRKELDVLERGADRAKAIWYQSFETLKRRERQLKVELELMGQLDARLQSVEKMTDSLSEKYRRDLESFYDKAQDERSLIRYVNKSHLRSSRD